MVPPYFIFFQGDPVPDKQKSPLFCMEKKSKMVVFLHRFLFQCLIVCRTRVTGQLPGLKKMKNREERTMAQKVAINGLGRTWKNIWKPAQER